MSSCTHRSRYQGQSGGRTSKFVKRKAKIIECDEDDAEDYDPEVYKNAYDDDDKTDMHYRNGSVPKRLRGHGGDGNVSRRGARAPSKRIRHLEAKKIAAINDVTSFSSRLDIEVALAHKYDGEVNVTGWMVSEKLDGMRCVWNGRGALLSRSKNVIHAPAKLLAALPRGIILDGELFRGRGKFQECMSIVRRHQVDEARWNDIKFVVFDAPCDKPFVERIEIAKQSITPSNYVEVLEQVVCTGHQHVKDELKRVEALGGEGLMLRHPTAEYQGGRVRDLLKVKSAHDAEAKVVGHVAGKGKHEGRMGALMCKMLPSGKAFKVGTGFSDEERRKPPKVGSIITYSYFELTKDQVPRFPAFVRQRVPE
eukprot:m.111154 g.111154  ORF g.111154 m.111154 type:complete len:366 (-) comp16995_c0_seq1:228-1325(-)